VTAVLESLSGFIWGPTFLIPLLVGTGLYLTIILRGLQFRELGHSLWLALVKRRERDAQGDITHFQALMTALAATVGTGNIAGVATAIAAGGPGALFWMWITGLLGMATKYAEALLSVRYREVDAHGNMAGGPMYFLARGIRVPALGRGLAAAFAMFAGLAAFGIGNGVQSEEVGNALHATFAISPHVSRFLLAAAVAAVTLGGIRSIGRFAGVLVPVMIVAYVAAAGVILVVNAAEIPRALAAVFEGAFQTTAVAGGLLGASVAAAIRFGFARGIFSNESGLGSAGIAAAAAATREPVRQAMISMTQTFIDTLVICTMTGLVILTSVVKDADRVGPIWQPAEMEAVVARLTAAEKAGTLDVFSQDYLAEAERLLPEGAHLVRLARWKTAAGSEWTTLAFRESLPGDFGGAIVSISLVLFAFSTIIGWSYYGEKSLEYLAGGWIVRPYRLVFSAMVVVGPLVFDRTIWLLSDVMNGLMAVPNLIGLLLLSPVVLAETRAYFARETRERERREMA
jgi:AGCS family alanine or glycine:cation symporter